MVCFQYHLQRKNNFGDWEGDQISPNHFKRQDSKYIKRESLNLKNGCRLVLYIKEWDKRLKEPSDLIDIINL